MGRLVCAALAVLFAAALAQADIGEAMFKGVYDFAINAFTLNIKGTIRLIALNMAAKPDLKNWPLMSAVHDSFFWLSGFFMVALMYQGIRYVLSADSPGGRANAKLAVEKIIVGMIIVSMNGVIFQEGLNFSAALTDAFVGPVDATEPALAKLLFLGSLELACLIAPLGLICVVLLFLMFLCRFMVLILIWAFFPAILALYFSQIGYLARLGQKGVNLFVSAIAAGPIMGLLFRVSYGMLIAAAASFESSSQARINGLEPFLALFMSLIGFLLAGLSPIITFGLFDRAAAVIGMATTAVGAVVGGAAGGAAGAAAGGLVTSAASSLKGAAGDVAGRTQPTVKNDLKQAEEFANERLRMAAVKTAATGDYDDTPAGRARFAKDLLQNLKEDGTVKVDGENNINVGDGGRQVAKRHPEILEDYGEWSSAYGRGYGDKKSRKTAEERGLVSDGRVVMKNAAQGQLSQKGKNYDIVVNGGEDGLYNVMVEGPGASALTTVQKIPGMNTKETVIQMIMELSDQSGKAPTTVLKYMNGGQDYHKVPDGKGTWQENI
ncbi:MAG: hypothetical protein V1875_09440 [Candidatus Altiarchaeota archaeon]